MIETRICYLCNQKLCTICTYPTCKHTTDVRYSLNYDHIGYVPARELVTKFEKHVVGVNNNRTDVYFEKEETHDN